MPDCPNSASLIRTSFIASQIEYNSHPVFEREIVLQNSIILSNAVIKDWKDSSVGHEVRPLDL